MLDQAEFVQFTVVASELQALILEALLIKTFAPKYNIRLKDDRSPLYIVITDEPFPRILTTHKSTISHTPYAIRSTFGPFPSGFKAKQVIKAVRPIFRFCNASASQKQKLQKCFYYHINLCSGACTGQVKRVAYLSMIRQLENFLSGNQQKIITTLTRTMKHSSKNHLFEKAAEARDKLNFINLLQEKKFAGKDKDEIAQNLSYMLKIKHLSSLLKIKNLKRIEAYDVSNIGGKSATGAMVVFQNGRAAPNLYRHFKIRGPSKPNDVAMIAQILKRRLTHLDWPSPQLIVVDGGKIQVNAVLKSLADSKFPPNSPKKSIPVIGITKRLETLIINNRKRQLPRSAPALKLVQELRDESHRFSQRLHHKLQTQKLLS